MNSTPTFIDRAAGHAAEAPGTVTLARALHQVRTFVRQFVVLSADQGTTIALWTAHTHALSTARTHQVAAAAAGTPYLQITADCTPYLQITSATKRAGKTRLLEVLEPLVAEPWFTGRTSSAALVRKIHESQPTLLLDESDAAFGGEKDYAEALRGVLNTGYRRSGKATLCVGQGANFIVKDFKTFCPKAIAGIGRLPDTVADRSILIALRRRRSDEPCERWRARDGHRDAAPICEAVKAAVAPLLATLTDARPAIPTTLSDRQADTWEPLLAIADAAGGDWPTRARTAATSLASRSDDEEMNVELLRDIQALPDELHAMTVLPSRTLVEHLVAFEDRPWATWRHGQPITERGLRMLLKPFDIHPDRDKRVRGYRPDAFQDAIARYLPNQVGKCHSPNETGPQVAFSKCHPEPEADTWESEETPITTGHSDTCPLASEGTNTRPETTSPSQHLLPRLCAALAGSSTDADRAKTLITLSKELDVTVDRVDWFIKARPKMFTLVTRTPDGVHRIALASTNGDRAR